MKEVINISINIIAAIDKDYGLGYENKLLFRIRNDLKRFKELTTGQFVLMGSLTYKSIGKPLPNRMNIIVSRNPKYEQPKGTFVYHSIADVITEYTHYNDDEKELFIIGGANVYKQTIDIADKIYLTMVDETFDKVDSYFPLFDLKDWKVLDEELHFDEKTQLPYKFITLKRIK